MQRITLEKSAKTGRQFFIRNEVFSYTGLVEFRGHFLFAVVSAGSTITNKKTGFSGFRLPAALSALEVTTSLTPRANNGFAALTIPCPKKMQKQQKIEKNHHRQKGEGVDFHSSLLQFSVDFSDNLGMKYSAVLIGTGRIGFTLGFDKKREQPASHAMALSNNSHIKLVAACDTCQENLLRFQKHFKKTRTFSTSEELYSSIEKIDLITVAVNESAHLEECIKAIERKPRLVILEKPVALNSQEAEKIRQASNDCHVPVLVNHERRFANDYNKAKKLMSEIGDIQSVRGFLNSGLRVYGQEFEKDGTYSLLHDGTHLVDIVSFLLEDDSSKNILHNPYVTSIHRDEKNIVRNFSAFYSTEKIPHVEISMSGRSKFFEFGVEVTGTLGRICIGNGYFKYYRRKESRLYTGFYSLTSEKVRLPKKTGYFANMIQNAVDYLDGKTTLKSPLEVAIKDLKILEDIKSKLI